MGVVLCCVLPASVAVAADPPVLTPQLVFREVEITGDEFIVLQNAGTGDIDHLNVYWLGYASDDAVTTVAPPIQQLPDRPLHAGQAMLLSGGASLDVCDAVLVAQLEPTLSNTAGTLALWQQASGSFTQVTTAQAQVRWSKSTSKTTLPAGEIDLKQETDQYTNPVWYFDPTTGWALGDFANCSLTTYASADDTAGTQAANWPPNDTQPPAVIESLSDDGDGSDAAGPSMPAADIGLKPPQLNELLPNPAGTGTDGTDEFIELYNPNTTTFDLSGFILQTGLSTKHNYTFPAGVTIPARSFTAFYSAVTGLSLSNTSSQVDLTDTFGTVIAQTDPYTSAKDGQAWALANGTWYWTGKLTPGAANVINQTGSTSGSQTTTARTTSSTKPATGGQTKAASTTASTTTTSAANAAAEVTPIHYGVLAAVAATAVAYGLYEYRHDVANKLHQLRVYRDARRAGRK